MHTKFARSFHLMFGAGRGIRFVSVPDHCFFICYIYIYIYFFFFFVYEFLIKLTLSVIIYAILAVLNHPVVRKDLSI